MKTLGYGPLLVLLLGAGGKADWQDQVLRLGRDPFVLDLVPTSTQADPEHPAEIVSELMPLRFADAQAVAELVTPLLGPGGALSARPGWIVARDTPSGLLRVKEALLRIDTPPRQLLLEASILDVTLDKDHATGIDWEVLTGVDYSTLNGSTDLVSVTRDSISGARLDRSLVRTAQEGFAGASGGLSVGVVKNGVSALVRAIANETDLRVVSRPRVLVLEGAAAYVHIGERLGYRTSTTTQTTTTDEIQFLDTGTVLRFTATRISDGRVRLVIAPSQSSGAIDAQGLPSEKITEVETQVLVDSGDTVVLGGLINENDETTETGVPLLRSIPLLGRLFSRVEVEKRRQEIVITVTPQVMPLGGDGDAHRDDPGR